MNIQVMFIMLLFFGIAVGVGHGVGWIKLRRDKNRELRKLMDKEDDMGAI